MKKKFSDTKVGTFLKEKAPQVLNKIGEIAGKSGIPIVSQIGNVVDMMIPEMKEEIQPLIDAYESGEMQMLMDDLADARSMNIAIQDTINASWLSKNVAYMMDILLTIIWGGITAYIFGMVIKVVGDGKDFTAVLSIYSTVTAVFMVVLQFHRGTSRSSQDKSDTIKKLIQ